MLTGCSPSRAWRPLAVLVVTFHNFLRAPALSSWNSAGAYKRKQIQLLASGHLSLLQVITQFIC